ncbi:MAG: hypothetical protein M1832_002517 [Thelocarpon impressellum]|nr:MAG: hypothetical protein M1832_002517 [Thelocarpon impressellum]
MASDVREPPSSPEEASREESAHSLKTYETFPMPPPPSANAFPGGTENTAGGRQEEVSLKSMAGSITLEDFRKVHKQPCVRDSLLLGIGGGFGVGGVRAVVGAGIPKASNWAVGTFVGVSFAAYEYCRYKRRLEMQGMKKAVEIIDRKKAEREARAREAREARRRAKEVADRAEEEQKKRAWKFW